MLFTSLVFVLAFLPGVFVVYIILMRRRLTALTIPWLTVTSIVFYGWGDVRLLAVIAVSLAVNFALANAVAWTGSRRWMTIGIGFNLSLLCYMKYAGLLGSAFNVPIEGPGLPLVGISFYTFQQIAFLIDIRITRKRPRFWSYLLFVTFFPQLIAGPIVHHSEMMPQFARLMTEDRKTYLSLLSTQIAVGLTIFAIGLFKKVVIADSCAQLSTPMFTAAANGETIGTLAAWGGTLAYTMQIYFDFSGYSDMAVGIARLFGIRLPMNFYSPYKAGNIIEFWRRWHMTLSRFLRDYIYIPLGGSRKGPKRRHINLMATMLIGGFWHGAAWSYVAWGGIHGAALVINHLWNQHIGRKLGPIGWLLTFLVVVNAWVLFKAGEFFPADFQTARSIYNAMYIWQPSDVVLTDYSIVAGAMLVAVLWPNTYQIMRRYRPVLEKVPAAWLVWRPTVVWGVIIAAMASIYLYFITRSDAYVEFIYFQF